MTSGRASGMEPISEPLLFNERTHDERLALKKNT